MDLKIFNVEHGACALLEADNRARMMIDCGHNASFGWRPGSYLVSQNIFRLEMLAITNYDEDHVSGIENLFDSVDVTWLKRNVSVNGKTLKSLKSEDGMGAGIDRLVRAIDYEFTGSVGGAPYPTFSGLVESSFSNSYPTFDDENNLSLVLHLNCHGVGVLFTGDLERAGWLALLEREDFRRVLRNTNIFVASHHGRANGCCEEVFEYCDPTFIVISDKGYMHETQQTLPFYRRFARGGYFRGENRFVLTTRNDGGIGFNFSPTNWYAY
ncbi:MAG: hypothetical protein Q7S99_05575 [Parvibaculum sp.]|nr:hypothetical protein [Parvibaculum sp.]